MIIFDNKLNFKNHQRINYKQKMLKYLFGNYFESSCKTCDELTKKYPDLRSIIAEANMHNLELNKQYNNNYTNSYKLTEEIMEKRRSEGKTLGILFVPGPSDNINDRMKEDQERRNKLSDIFNRCEILSKENNLSDIEKRLFDKCIKYSPDCMYYPKK